MEPVAPDWRTIGSAPARQGAQPVSGSGRPSLSTRHLAWVAGAFLATLVLGASIALLLMPAPGGVVIDARDGGGPRAVDAIGTHAVGVVDGLGPAVPDAPRGLVVDVEGAVVRTGVVHVPAGGRVGDAIELAGGFAANADLAAAADLLNLAQEVSDGLKIVVPAIGDASTDDTGGTSTTGATDQGTGLVDLNRATEPELDALPGVGPATIAKIVAAREESPFGSVDELRSRGIVGDATLAKLRARVTVGR